MTRPSWKKRKNGFYYILSLLMVLHLGVLFLRFKVYVPSQTVSKVVQEKTLKVKLQKVSPFEFKKQIVQSEDSKLHEKKADKFLSDKDRFFDRQTVARKIGVFQKGANPGGAPSQSGQPRKGMKLSDLGANVGEKHPLLKAAEEYTKAKNGVGSGKDQSRQVSSTNDYLPEVPLGDMTRLNTAEYKYYGFYHRVRQKLEQFWGRSIQEKAALLAKGGRRVPASDELITALEITMDNNGEILRIRVVGSSGVKELDDAAIEAFNDAGPFPNPPQGLIKDGQVMIEWGFVVST